MECLQRAMGEDEQGCIGMILVQVLEIDSESCDQKMHPTILLMSAKSDHLLQV
jgi:hypothetical protein